MKRRDFLKTSAIVTGALAATDASAHDDEDSTLDDANSNGRGAVSVGPPTRYFVDVERYRFGRPDMANGEFYPVPQDEVTRDTYLRCVDAMDVERLASQPDHGIEGPRAFVPVLAKYVQTGDSEWACAIEDMLRACHAGMQQRVEDNRWFWQFEHPSTLIPLYRRCLIDGGAMAADADWFREMWLYYCRNLHVWDSEPTEWRGACHRSMPEAYSKGRAAAWYPDIPEAARWSRYSQLVFRDFWRHKDVPQNDTGYMMGPILVLALGGDQWVGDDRVYTDAGMKRLWDRLMVEVTPDGAVNPYGPNGGWNSTASYRLAMLERVAAKTGDGRYRYVAHKLLNYMRYQESGSYRLSRGDDWLVALAYLFADESVRPTQPEAGSLQIERVEAIRVPHTDKAVTERLIGDADPHAQRGHICCSWHMTGKKWPDKLVLRSGWNPGDLFGLVELHPTSFPANPGGIMGLNRWGAPFTQIVTSKGDSPENRLHVEDLSGSAGRRHHADKMRINEYWRAGAMPDIRSSVAYFEETAAATFARVRVENADGLPVSYEREFVFAKNRFLATRETVTFEEGFAARVSPLWNTQNVGPQIGAHWANTFISGPVGDNGRRTMPAPPVDLLVWFAPRDDARLHVVDRFTTDPRTEACPTQLRYVWEGEATPGQRLSFTQVLLPHMPHRARATTNNPNPGGGAEYRNEMEATAGASGIHVVRDDEDVTVLRLELEPDKVEWVAFNPQGSAIDIGGGATDAPYSYVAEASGDSG